MKNLRKQTFHSKIDKLFLFVAMDKRFMPGKGTTVAIFALTLMMKYKRVNVYDVFQESFENDCTIVYWANIAVCGVGEWRE